MRTLSQNDEAVLTAYEKGYRVINGVVHSPFRNGPLGTYIKYTKSRGNYAQFTIFFYGKRAHIGVHRLVAYQKFGDEVFKPGIQTRHKDGNSLNNSDDNILIGTAKENAADKTEYNKMKSVMMGATAIRKFSDEKVNEIRSLREKGWNYPRLMAEYGIKSKGTLFSILNRNYQTSVAGG